MPTAFAEGYKTNKQIGRATTAGANVIFGAKYTRESNGITVNNTLHHETVTKKEISILFVKMVVEKNHTTGIINNKLNLSTGGKFALGFGIEFGVDWTLVNETYTPIR